MSIGYVFGYGYRERHQKHVTLYSSIPMAGRLLWSLRGWRHVEEHGPAIGRVYGISFHTATPRVSYHVDESGVVGETWALGDCSGTLYVQPHEGIIIVQSKGLLPEEAQAALDSFLLKLPKFEANSFYETWLKAPSLVEFQRRVGSIQISPSGEEISILIGQSQLYIRHAEPEQQMFGHRWEPSVSISGSYALDQARGGLMSFVRDGCKCTLNYLEHNERFNDLLQIPSAVEVPDTKAERADWFRDGFEQAHKAGVSPFEGWAEEVGQARSAILGDEWQAFRTTAGFVDGPWPFPTPKKPQPNPGPPSEEDE